MPSPQGESEVVPNVHEPNTTTEKVKSSASSVTARTNSLRSNLPGNGQVVVPHEELIDEDKEGFAADDDELDEEGNLKKKKKLRINPLRWQKIPPIPSEPRVSKEATASLLSKLTFHWIGDFMKTGYLRPLTLTDIPTVPPYRSSRTLTAKVDESFKRRLKNGEKNPLLWALNESLFMEFWTGGLARLIGDILLVMTPFTLKYLIQFSSEAYAAHHNPNIPAPYIGRGIGLAFAVALLQSCASFAMGQFVYRGMITGGQARAALIGLIFAKSLRISARAKAGTLPPSEVVDEKNPKKKNKDTEPPNEGWTNGHITNLMSTDTYRVDSCCSWFHIMWTSPVLITLTVIILLINISYSALAGFALLVLGVPGLTYVIKILAVKRRQMNKITDKRVGLTQEILLGVRFVKYYAWEQSFLNQLKRLRSEEIKAVQFLLGVRSAVNAVGMSLPVFASMLAFITYSLVGNNLSPASVFSSLALFNGLRMPLNLLPVVAGQVVDAWISIQRIEAFLKAEEVEDDRAITQLQDPNAAIAVMNGDFTWEKSSGDKNAGAAANQPVLKADVKAAKQAEKVEKKRQKAERKADPNTPPTEKEEEEEEPPFHLNGINVSFGKSELVAVVGTVGSGKTSLLAALAGEMRKTNGHVAQAASLAYCPQYAWIQNATVKDNIVFGKDFDKGWYRKVIYACALQPDLDMLPNGDLTEIGERGITVSGGQKQRMNIARAIYFDADIVLMDDPLSAVDAHVGRHLFDEAICGLLKEKCRILATHQLHVLERCDRVVFMEDGCIRAVGTLAELTASEEGFRAFLGEFGKKAAEEEKEEEEVVDDGIAGNPEQSEEARRIDPARRGSQAPEKKAVAPKAGLMQAEERATSAVPWSVYKAYIVSSGSILVAPAVILLLALSQAANIMTTLWLSYWTSGKYGLSRDTYIGVFASLGVAQSLLMFAFSYSLTIAGTTSSKVLMTKAMEKVLRAPMSFFDTTPIGRIINRFSKDIDVMDNNLTDAIRMYFMTLAMISSVCILIIVYFPYFAIALVPLIILFLFATSYYRASARSVKRHESVLRSVVYAKFGESLTGISTIRAYGLQSRFINDLHVAVDDMDRAYFITFANQRWLSLRLDLIGNMLVFVTGILVVTSRFSVNPSIAGVVLSYVLQIVMMIQWMIRQLAEVENAMNATERLHHYGTSLPSEAPLHTNADVHLRPTWPEAGKIEFRKVQMRYRPGLQLVLKGVDLDIRGGERIGIVGRTGAGKSSVMSALFRLVELDKGEIVIDGVNIKDLGLYDLRTKLAIIPQDPTLFRGTVRSNLDPFGNYTDEVLWAALRKSYLVEDVDLSAANAAYEALPGQTNNQQKVTLDTAVSDAGENFSLGQRQLMALARALVRDARIIVADEATSSVDHETDRKIQRTMREGFRGKTVLCIAHRLGTVLGYDRVVVMEDGMVAEVGRPKELWEESGSRWRGMCDRGGVKEEDFEREGGWVGDANDDDEVYN
ncbi:P-loop containing nucleoside triphosphate hydrolase protein [Peziza echinospora]|nr:P-loop containing nucleoside triphosphate hydrolase protein [Peziza echinospora]